MAFKSLENIDLDSEKTSSSQTGEIPFKVGVKRKQSALNEPTSTIKHQRIPSGAHALHGMKEGLVEFTEVFHDAMSGKKSGLEASPIRKSMAMKRAQELETDLSDGCIVGLIDLFQADVALADAYLSLSCEAIRKKWVRAWIKGIIEEEEIQ